MSRPFSKIDSQEVFTNRIFKVRRDVVRSPRLDTEHEVFVLETADWINVIPVTPDGRVVMVRQWRHGTRQVTLEIPGGMIDPADADPEAAASRELREETGYEAGGFAYLGTVDPNPAIQANACHSYLASDCHPSGIQDLDQGEDIEVVLLPLEEIPRLIIAGEIRHSLVVAAFAQLEIRFAGGDLPGYRRALESTRPGVTRPR